MRIIFLGLFLFLLVNGKIMIWLILYGSSLIIAIFFGRFYCGYVCPMNTLMIPVEWVSKKLGIQVVNSPKWLKSGYFSWIMLFVSVAVMILSKRFLPVNIPVLPFWAVVSVLVTLRYKPAVFHNFICPFGVLQKTFGRFSKFSKKVDELACIGCGICESVCPSEAIEVTGLDQKAIINSTLCHQCDSCQQVCPKAAIHYRNK